MCLYVNTVYSSFYVLGIGGLWVKCGGGVPTSLSFVLLKSDRAIYNLLWVEVSLLWVGWQVNIKVVDMLLCRILWDDYILYRPCLNLDGVAMCEYCDCGPKHLKQENH
jgi:hypothetical protein